jgi:hypothetical protein
MLQRGFSEECFDIFVELFEWLAGFLSGFKSKTNPEYLKKLF